MAEICNGIAELQDKCRELEQSSEQWRNAYMVERERRRQVHNRLQEVKGNIQVFVRVRPLLVNESGTCIVTRPRRGEIEIFDEKSNSNTKFQFNEVFDSSSSNAKLFGGGIGALVTSMLDGYNVCIFAYGQTNSGKTFSMGGADGNAGIYSRTFDALFEGVAEMHGVSVDFVVSVFEIYNQDIRDLLLTNNDTAKVKLQVKEKADGTGHHVPGLVQQRVKNKQEVEELLRMGQINRTTKATNSNATSSRSHLVVQINGTMKAKDGESTTSCITMVDLAGSERPETSGAVGDRLTEARAINVSLHWLGVCIGQIVSQNNHVHFRNSVLTSLLQDSLKGDSKVLLLLQISPWKETFEESVCSLNFGNLAKKAVTRLRAIPS